MDQIVTSMTVDYPASPPYRTHPTGRRRQRLPPRFERVVLPMSVLRATSDVVCRIGHEWREAYVWWGGYVTPDGVAQICTALVPEIGTLYGRVAFGLSEYSQLHEQLRQRDQILIAELHSHPPGAGGQNEVDAAHAAAPYPGFLSIVIPNFGFPFFHDVRSAHVYEYIADSNWTELSRDEIERRFCIEDTIVRVKVS